MVNDKSFFYNNPEDKIKIKKPVISKPARHPGGMRVRFLICWPIFFVLR